MQLACVICNLFDRHNITIAYAPNMKLCVSSIPESLDVSIFTLSHCRFSFFLTLPAFMCSIKVNTEIINRRRLAQANLKMKILDLKVDFSSKATKSKHFKV